MADQLSPGVWFLTQEDIDKVREQDTGWVKNYVDSLGDAYMDGFSASPPNIPFTPGVKHDDGKPKMYELLAMFPNAFTDLADISDYGEQKYGRDNWLDVAQNRYLDAAMRHLVAHAMGEPVDHESLKSHLVHASWNLLAAAELEPVS